MLLLVFLVILMQMGIAAISPRSFVIFAVWLQALPLTWNWDLQVSYATPIGNLYVYSMQLAGLSIACLMVMARDPRRVLELFTVTKAHIAFVVLATCSLLYAPSVDYGLRTIAKLASPLLFMAAFYVGVRNAAALRQYKSAAIWSGVLIMLIAVAAWLSGAKSDPNATITGMSGLGPPGMGPPVFAARMLPCAMLVLAFSLAGADRRLPVIFVLSALAIFATLQRTSVIALAIGSSVLMGLSLRGVRRFVAPIAALATAASLLLFSGAFRRRMFYEDMSGVGAMDTSSMLTNLNSSGRFGLWDLVLTRFFVDHKVAGSGIGATQHFLSALDGAPGVVHSEYVRVLCELGLLGLVCFLFVLISYLVVLRKLARHGSRETKTWAQAAVGALLCYFLYCATDNALDYVNQFGIYVFSVITASMVSAELDAKQELPFNKVPRNFVA